jgi:serine/threonine protein phosphatase PrpC
MTLSQDAEPDLDALHFFGVYDGHGGPDAARFCAHRLHTVLAAALLHCLRVHALHERGSLLADGVLTAASNSAALDMVRWNQRAVATWGFWNAIACSGIG